MTVLVSFVGISQSLPTTSYIKMVDIFMIFTMVFPFVEVCLHATKQVLLNHEAKHECHARGEKQARQARQLCVLYSGKRMHKVKPLTNCSCGMNKGMVTTK